MQQIKAYQMVRFDKVNKLILKKNHLHHVLKNKWLLLITNLD